VFSSLTGLSQSLGPIIGAALVRLDIPGHPRPAHRHRVGLNLLPVGIAVVIVSPLTGRLIAARGPGCRLRYPGAALAAGGGTSM
jgi:hypothetical protein